MTSLRARLLRLTLAASLLGAGACDCAPEVARTCRSSADCADGQICRDQACVPAPMLDAASPDAFALDAAIGDAPVCPVACGASCCRATEACYRDTCIPDGPTCTTSADCTGDTYCATDAAPARCVPYGVPSDHVSDPACTRLIVAGTFAPTVQCEFREAPAGDAFPANLHVLTTPMVVDFAIGRGPDEPRRPSIVAVFDDGVDGSSEQPTGVIRILDGATCAQQAELGSLQLTSHSSPPAVGDLDGDGRAEIVAYQAGGGLVAFTYDARAGAWAILWRSHLSDGSAFSPTGAGWAGPTIVDMDDDGTPEVLRGTMVFAADGTYLGGMGAAPEYSAGQFPVVIDVDLDGRLEHVNGDLLREWDPTTRTWSVDPISTSTQTPGFTAVADFGDFPGTASLPAATPEIVVITSGAARVQTLDGTIVFGPVALPGGGTGGPPTIGDFDGDGRPELASAGGSAYTVFDLDCTSAGGTGACASGRTDGVLWTQPSQDQSSNVTGSSIFDFEGDGAAEAVYGDECFIRVYAGATGDVLFSQSRSSCTWYENPVIADLDGDFNAEIVIGDNYNCGAADSGRNCSGFGLGPRNTDPIFAGLRCGAPEDCLSGVCDAGFCRCTADTECCSGAGCDRAAFVCEVPPTGTPGTGNTCRASRPIGTLGIRVYRDAADRWVNSRRIWNQHPYYVTNVSEEGVVPRTSAVMSNWLDPSLNNFRQNVQGDLVPGASPDLTTGGSPLSCSETTARLQARVCNRGTEPVGSGVTVGFFVGDPMAGGTEICTGSSVRDLAVGECEMVTCEWPEAPREGAMAVDVYVVADAEGIAGECREDNNVTVFEDVWCGALF
ncbi:MAG: VCBS repeat-containing protein [Sandaracinaceae bacterium]|nr:VCBS repeat-containing protein [Sandaracinaceae bacterium]